MIDIETRREVAREKMEDYRALMRLRRTPERNHVLDIVLDQDEVFTTQDVCADVDDNISQSTVYNCMEFFLAADIIEKVPSFGKEMNYRLKE